MWLECPFDQTIFRATVVAITVGGVGLGLIASVRRAAASTIGNTDLYSDFYKDSAPSTIISPLLAGVSEQVNQRYGCTIKLKTLVQVGRTVAQPPVHGVAGPNARWG